MIESTTKSSGILTVRVIHKNNPKSWYYRLQGWLLRMGWK